MGSDNLCTSPVKCCAFVSALSAALLLVLGLTVAAPGLIAKNFKETTCVVVSVENMGYQECNCSEDNNNGSQCFSNFTCYSVTVTYTTEDKTNVTAMVRRNEYASEDDCAAYPICDANVTINERSVDKFLLQFGANTSYPCFYNPAVLSQVIIEKRFSNSYVIISLVIPSILFTISFLCLIVFLLQNLCGCSSSCCCTSNSSDGFALGVVTNAAL